jgi:Holliday junction resolvasome RuvABC endonuclease subunit
MIVEPLRILSIDPGSRSTGVCVMDCSPDETFNVLFAHTIHAAETEKKYNFMTFLLGDKFTRSFIINKTIKKILAQYSPSMVIIEKTFYNPKSFRAFLSLFEIAISLRAAIFRTENTMPFYFIDASKVKKAMGVGGTTSDKELMREALRGKNLKYHETISLDNLDEHSVDAICVGVAKYKELLLTEDITDAF